MNPSRARTRSIAPLLCSLSLLAGPLGCQGHPDDRALEAALAELELPEASSAHAPVTPAFSELVVTTDEVFWNLEPLARSLARNARKQLEALLKERGDSPRRRAWRVDDEQGHIRRAALVQALDVLESLGQRGLLSSQVAQGLRVRAGREVEASRVIMALDAAHTAGFTSPILVRTKNGQLVWRALDVCEQLPELAGGPPPTLRCDLCELIEGEQARQGRRCAAPLVHVTPEGFGVVAAPAASGPDGCTRPMGPPAPQADGPAQSWEHARLLLDRGSCPGAPADQPERLIELLEQLDERETLCAHVVLAPDPETTWGDLISAHSALARRWPGLAITTQARASDLPPCAQSFVFDATEEGRAEELRPGR